MENSNYYEEREKKNFSSSKPENENNISNLGKKDMWMDILTNVGIDAGIAVLGGGVGAAALGRYSLIAGALLTGYGHYKKNDKLRVLGIGLMASSSMTHCAKQDPKASTMENMTERIKAFGKELQAKLFLDKLMKSESAPNTQTKPTDDLKGTEQKKNTTSDAQNTQKPEPNKTTTDSKQTVKPETDYHNPNSTGKVDKMNGEEKIKEQYTDLDLEELLGIEGKLY